MKRNYNLSHRLIACILFISLFLQSCGGFQGQIAPQEKKQPSRTLKLSDNPLVNTYKEIVTSGSYLASFYEDEGELKANLRIDETQAEPNYKGVHVLPEEGADLSYLTKLDPKTQQNRIQPIHKNGTIDQVIIFNGGAAGGMMRRELADNNQQGEGGEGLENLCSINFKELYSSSIISNHNLENENNQLILLALELKSSYHDNKNLIDLQNAVKNFKLAAKNGSSIAMYYIGLICEEYKSYDLAVRWYVLSFQHSWFKDLVKSYKSLAYKRLLELGNESKEAGSSLRRIQLLYPSDVDTPEKIFGRLNALIPFYENGTAEPYLNKEEIGLKISRLKQEIKLILQAYESKCLSIQSNWAKGIKFAENNLFNQAEVCFLESQQLPASLHNLGWLYEEGYIGKEDNQPNYEKAAEFYKKAATVESFGNLGRLYQNGLIERRIDGTPDYPTAKEYLELSGNPEALCNLGIMFKEGYVDEIGGIPDYQTAQEYFKRSDIGSAHTRLGELYMQGYLGKNVPQPDYEQAKHHFEISAEKNYPKALTKLGYLYLNGYVGKKRNKPNYRLAVNCLNEATKSSNIDQIFKAEAFHNLGVIYVEGHYGQKRGQPNYQEAKNYFEESGTPESLYNIGSLYELEHIRKPSKTSKKGEQPNCYQIASEYYSKSETANAKIALLGLYQLGLIECPEEQKENMINEIIKQIDNLQGTLSNSEGYYVKGIAEYYIGNWESALISLQQALAFGSEEAELEKLIAEIEDYLAEEKTTEGEIVGTSLTEEEKKEGVVTDLSPMLKEKEVPTELPTPKKVEDNSPSIFPIVGGTIKEKKAEAISSVDKKNLKYEKFQRANLGRMMTEEEKRERKSRRVKLNFLNSLDKGSKTAKINPSDVQFVFENDKKGKEFFELVEKSKKIQALLQDIRFKPWGTEGGGKPEVLIGHYDKNKKCFSRRINKKDRLVYEVFFKAQNKGKILILDWEKHYKK